MKRYFNQATSLSIVSGKILEKSEDGRSIVMEGKSYDQKEKKYIDERVTIKSPVGFADDIEVGKMATAVGYPAGGKSPNPNVALIDDNPFCTTRNATFEQDGICVICGTIGFANDNKELDANGNKKFNKAGAPKKEHFDVTISVPTGKEGEYIPHIVQIYEYKSSDKPNEKSIFEKSRNAIKGVYVEEEDPAPAASGKRKEGFLNFSETPTYACLVTQPGTLYPTNEQMAQNPLNEDGSERKQRCYHLGLKSFDVTPLYECERFFAKSTKKSGPAAPAPTAEPVAQTAQAAPVQTASAPAPAPTPVQTQVQPAAPAPAPAPAPAVQPAQPMPAPAPVVNPAAPTQQIGGQSEPIQDGYLNDPPF